MWLQPASRQRRRRRFPIVPVLVLVLLLALAGAAYAVVHRRHAAEDRRQATVQRFAAAWAKRDYGAMWDVTTAASKRADSRAQFAASYGDAARQGDDHRDPHGPDREPLRRCVPRAGDGQHTAVRRPARDGARPRARRGRCGAGGLVARAAPARPAAGREREAQDPLAPDRAAILAADGRRLDRPPASARSSARRRAATAPAAGCSAATTSASAAGPARSCASAIGSSAA